MRRRLCRDEESRELKRKEGQGKGEGGQGNLCVFFFYFEACCCIFKRLINKYAHLGSIYLHKYAAFRESFIFVFDEEHRAGAGNLLVVLVPRVSF